MHINKKTIITKEIDEALSMITAGPVFRSHKMNNAMENMANVDNSRKTGSNLSFDEKLIEINHY